ncbi:MAG: amidohydrolase family protein [Synergistaceae bacterium]|nr:amidohydrolase family protein [Synergistaceae bacterium]
MSQYLFRNAQLCEISAKRSSKKDIRVKDGIISEISDSLVPSENDSVIDIDGKYLSPGWTDSHAHIYVGDSLGVPQDMMLYSGVTFVVDAGTAGPMNFGDFVEGSLKPAKLPAKSYLHIAPYGVNKKGVELMDLSKVDVDMCVDAARLFRDYVIGIKLRIDPRVCEDCPRAMKLAKEIAHKAGLPTIVHASRTDMKMEDVLAFLERGDVFAHTYANKTPGILDENGRVKKCVFEARERGVFFDVSHGKSNFSFDVMTRAVEQGFLPDVVSTDLHKGSIDTVHSLPEVMSKVMGCGVEFWDVLQMVTENAAKMLGLPERNIVVAEGRRADFTVFTVDEGRFTFTDADGKSRECAKKVVPFMSVMGGEIFTHS